MDSFVLIQIVLYVTIVSQLGLIGLLLSATRHLLVRSVIIALALACAIWPLCILIFLQQTVNLSLALAVVRIFYIDAGIIGALLIILAHLIPYRREISFNLVLWLLVAVGGIVVMVLLPNGFVESIELNPEHNSATLNVAYNIIYTLYFAVVAVTTMTMFASGYRKAIRRRQHQIAAQTRTMIAGIAVALAFGLWFNLLLPFFGDYRYVWAGPPFTLLFVVAMFYAVIGQGLFDLRAALARYTAYLLLLVTMVAGYAIVVFAITDIFIGSSNRRGTLIAFVILALLFTLTYPPIKRYFDQLTYRWFYHDDFDLQESLADLTAATSEEIRLDKLVRRSLDVIGTRLAVNYVTAYIVDDSGRVRQFTVGPNPPTARQRQAQIEIVGTLLDRLPRVLNAHDSQILDKTGAQQAIRRANVTMLLQFVVQREHIGALFVGDKQSGMSYADKDLQLLTTAADELALAILNSQRFEEIEHFNDTLKSRVDSATKRLRRSNQELKKLDRAKDEFVSLASHQLRTPLTSIKGYLSMVLEGDVGKVSPIQRQLLEQAFSSSERMVRLIGDFLSISRLQTDKFTIEAQPADINRLIEQIVATMHPMAAENQQKLSYDGVISKRMIMIDSAKIQQVVMNFIDNALYYSPRGGEVKVALDYSGNEVVMTVVDSGIGVPKDEQDGLFTKFYRASNARKRRPDGTGVGLYLVKKIVTAHGGSVIFNSKEDQGSTFGFRLPAVKPPEGTTK